MRVLWLGVVPGWTIRWPRDRGASRGVCQIGARIQGRGLIIPQVSRRAVAKRGAQRFVDGGFKLKDRRRAFARFVRIKSLKACHAFLQALEAPPLLSGRQRWRFRLWRRWDRTTGHVNPWMNYVQGSSPEKSGVRNGHLLPLKADCDSHVGMLCGLRYSPGRSGNVSSVGPFAGYGDERVHPNTPRPPYACERSLH